LLINIGSEVESKFQKERLFPTNLIENSKLLIIGKELDKLEVSIFNESGVYLAKTINVSPHQRIRHLKYLGKRYIAALYQSTIHVFNIIDNSLTALYSDDILSTQLIATSENRLISHVSVDDCRSSRNYIYIWNYLTGSLLKKFQTNGEQIIEINDYKFAYALHEKLVILSLKNYEEISKIYNIKCNGPRFLSNLNLVCLNEEHILIIDSNSNKIINTIHTPERSFTVLFSSGLLVVTFQKIKDIKLFDMLKGGIEISSSQKNGILEIGSLHELLNDQILIDYRSTYSIWDTKNKKMGKQFAFPPNKCYHTHVFFNRYICITICDGKFRDFKKRDAVESIEIIKASDQSRIYSTKSSTEISLAIELN
jgi:hypothetical protein